MSQSIPNSWLRGKKLHPCKYHAEVMRVLIGARNGITRSEIEKHCRFIIFGPDLEDGIDVCLRDFRRDGIATEREATRTRYGKTSNVWEWYIVSKEPPATGSFTNSLRFADDTPRLVIHPDEGKRIKKVKLTPIK